MIRKILGKFGVAPGHVFIGGKFIKSTSAEAVEITNPKDESVIFEVARGTAEDATKAIDAAAAAQPAWALRSAIERGDILLKFAALIEEHGDDLAKIATAEHGKPHAVAEAEIGFMLLLMRYVASAARHICGEIHHVESAHEQLWTQRVPYGVTVGLAPWNFPVAIAARKFAPALLAGNSIVVKPHELTPLGTLAVAELARRAGVPDGILNVVTGEGRSVGAALVTDPRTRLVSMTGSTRAGKEIYASAAPDLKVVRLELGGKAPFMVMEDADVDKAVDDAITAKFFCGGQICTANDRMYLHKAIHDEFLEKFLRKVGQLRVGDPNEEVEIGPWVSRAEIKKLDAISADALEEGATLLTAPPPKGKLYEKGNWVFPKVFSVKSNEPRIMRDEIFGPMVAALKVEDFEEALAYANKTRYGLTAYLHTKDNRRIMRCVNELEFGEIFINRTCGESVNGFHTGYKQSGLGGEDGMHGIEGYLRKKSMYNNYA